VRDRDSFEYEFVLAKLAEIDEALAELDARPDALDRAVERRLLVEEAARLAAALAQLNQTRSLS
jgi:hypothetical protein